MQSQELARSVRPPAYPQIRYGDVSDPDPKACCQASRAARGRCGHL
jgi:hypothetical protein